MACHSCAGPCIDGPGTLLDLFVSPEMDLVHFSICADRLCKHRDNMAERIGLRFRSFCFRRLVGAHLNCQGLNAAAGCKHCLADMHLRAIFKKFRAAEAVRQLSRQTKPCFDTGMLFQPSIFPTSCPPQPGLSPDMFILDLTLLWR